MLNTPNLIAILVPKFKPFSWSAVPTLHPPKAHLHFAPSPRHGQPCEPIPPQLNRVSIAPRLVPSKEVPAVSALPYNLLNPKLLRMLTAELPTTTVRPIPPPVTSLPNRTCDERSNLRRPTHRVSLVPKLIPVRRQLNFENPLIRRSVLVTCRCLPESDTVQRKPPRWTPRRTKPQHLEARLVTKLLTVTWAPALFRCLNLPNRPHAASTPNLLKTA